MFMFSIINHDNKLYHAATYHVDIGTCLLKKEVRLKIKNES